MPSNVAGHIATAIFSSLAALVGFFLRLDRRTVIIILCVVLAQAVLGYLIFAFASRQSRKQEQDRHAAELKRLLEEHQLAISNVRAEHGKEISRIVVAQQNEIVNLRADCEKRFPGSKRFPGIYSTKGPDNIICLHTQRGI